MIEGLKLRITSDELKSHCLARSVYHKQRAEDKAAELPGIEEALEKLKVVNDPKILAHMNKFSNSNYATDPESVIESIENDIRTHNEKSLIFTFFAEHLFTEDYTLMEADLKRLEMLK